MFETKYILSEPSVRTKARLVEIQFYMVYKSILEQQGSENTNDFFELFAKLLKVDTSKMLITVNMMKKYGSRPTKREMLIACRIMGVPYNYLKQRFGGDMRTVTKYVKDYLIADEPDLRPVLAPGLHDFIIVFLSKFHEFMVLPYENFQIFKKAGADFGEDTK